MAVACPANDLETGIEDANQKARREEWQHGTHTAARRSQGRASRSETGRAALRPASWIVYYSPSHVSGGNEIRQQFTAIGEITGAKAYQVSRGRDGWPRDPARGSNLLDALPSGSAPFRVGVSHLVPRTKPSAMVEQQKVTKRKTWRLL